MLTPYPELVEEIKEKLLGLRTSGIPLDRTLARTIILAMVKERQPHLLATFKCTEQYVGQFLQSKLSFTLRKGTRTAAKVPDNAEELCQRTLFRIVHLIHHYGIPPDLIVNMDQTGVLILMSSGKTYEKSGSRQVDIAKHDEKRAYTVCVATTPTGTILPFQSVWSGQSSASLPTPAAPRYQDAINEGFHFAYAKSAKKTSHFSTYKTMTEWMAEILLPYIKQWIEDNPTKARKNQRSILLIDCYPVHIGKDFRLHVVKEYPYIFLLFIPAGCTGGFQPADVGLNRVLKHFLRQQAVEFLVKEHTQQLSEGLTAEQVRFSTSIKTLRNASVEPLVKLYEYLRGPDGRDLIRMAWDKCTVLDFNLGAECLTSSETKEAYIEYLENDDTLRHEISNKIGRDALLNDNLVADEPEGDEQDDEDDCDATDVPLAAIVAAVSDNSASINISPLATSQFAVDVHSHCT